MIRLGFLFGAAFGFLLAAGGMTDYDVVHDALLFRDFHAFLVFGSAVLVALPLLSLLKRRRWRTPLGGPLAIAPSRVEPKFVHGGLVFGVGFGISGTCVAPALAMIGTGRLSGLATVAGLFAGLLLRDVVARHALHGADIERTKGEAAGSGTPAEIATGTAIGL